MALTGKSGEAVTLLLLGLTLPVFATQTLKFLY